MNVPMEKGVQTRFKEHFSFTKQEERWHFTCNLMRKINICSVSGVCLRAALSFTTRKKSHFYYYHMYYDLCCVSLGRWLCFVIHSADAECKLTTIVT